MNFSVELDKKIVIWISLNNFFQQIDKVSKKIGFLKNG